MSSRIVISVIFFLGLSVALGACRRGAEREQKQDAEAKPFVAPDGSIHLTPEQAQAIGLKTTAVLEQETPATLTAVGRVKARAGGAAQVFSPFAGRLMADPAKLPRVGSVVKKGAVIAEVEQLLTTAEQAQISGAAAQFAATVVQLQAAIE
jgi:biotin carboxyl carrier protein